MPTFALFLAYDGTRYNGWQRQCASAEQRRPSIQGELERALQRVLQQPVDVIGSGRTDAGVHARMQVAHVRCGTTLSAVRLRQALNAVLPRDIRVPKVRRVAAVFHARFSCTSKTYRYVIYNHSIAPVFDRWFVWHIALPLRADLMAAAARALIGRHDFSSFQAHDKKERSAVRTVRQLSVRKRGRYIVIDIEADGFVYSMVRSIVGTLVEVGKGNIPPSRLRGILRERTRAAAGPTAPAQGLLLYQVRYK